MDPKETPIVPLKQALIPLAGHQFLVVQLPNGQTAIIFSYLCEALDVDRWSQTRRIQEHPLLAEYLVTVQIKTTKGERIVNALVVWALSGWLSGFQLTRLSEEKRTVIMALQREAFDTFVRPFFTAEAGEQLNRPKQAPQPPLSQPEQPPTSLPEMLRAMADHVEQDQHKNAAWRSETERRVGILEEEHEALWATLTTFAPASPDALTADHQRTMHLLLREHHMITGQPIADLEQELAASLGVAGVHNIPEAAWNRLFAWFWRRTLEKE